jgi:hypothetical protein
MNNQEKQRRRGRPRKSDHAIKAIRLLAGLGYSDGQIRKWFEERLGHEAVTLPGGERVSPWYETVPDWTTIASYAKAYRPTDPSGWWDFASAPPEQVARVLPVAVFVFEGSRGGLWLTNDLAAIIDGLVAAAPDIPPLEAYMRALEMREAREDGDTTRQWLIGAYLSMRAWETKNWSAYRGLEINVEKRRARMASKEMKEATHDPE